jgi:DNA-directed RNA polymerase I subunit RPA1
MSYCKITSPVTHDALGNALTGGLYDAHMGPSDQQSPNCRTCGQIYMNCPGHPGHIELCVPVYHPMLFPNMFSLLRTKCSYCHTLRIAQSRTRQTLVKLKLLEMGELDLAKKMDDMVVPPTKENLLDVADENIVDQLKRFEQQLEDKLRQIERRYELFKRQETARRERGEPEPSATARQSNYIKLEQRAVLDAFYRIAMSTKKCENCGAFSLPLRRDGYAKIFQRPLQKRLERTMTAMRMRLKSGLETVSGGVRTADDATESEGEDPEDDTSGEDAGSGSDSDTANAPADGPAKAAKRGVGEADKYLVPLEVEAQLKLLWLSPAQPLLSYVWSRALGGAGGAHYPKEEYRLFFVRTVLVPPNRFRPPSLLGDITSEHPQNQQLAKVLSVNEKIANMNGNGSASASALSDKGFTQVISAWIELQNSLNCYMDSAKDPNPLGGSAAPPGIRQLLERKEGLFRHHMMGKRVNYCCRSVISPDPFIGTDEIGIPLRFAKTLQYAVPVTSWNAKYLQQLVENGPHEYPGANQIEMPDGKVVKLEKFTRQERVARARLLTSQPGIKVYRHLITGDALLVNRQPTLHKPGIMCHKARILTHMKEQTLRMNYANCNTYNADFDGDEMNCHFVQVSIEKRLTGIDERMRGRFL